MDAQFDPNANSERIGLIGFGAIGATVVSLLTGSTESDGAISDTSNRSGIRSSAGRKTTVVGVLRRSDAARAHSSVNPLGDPSSPKLFCSDLDDLLERRPQLVIECANHAAVDSYALKTLAAGCDLMLVSVGALANAERHQALLHAAIQHGRQILLPAGAIAGIDWLAASRHSGLNRVVYRSRKPPSAWMGTAAEELLDLRQVQSAQPFFAGNARDAALTYPKNANVAATVALAGIGFERTEVELIADPNAPGNVHEIQAEGVAGNLLLQVLGHPDPGNPKTSMLTAYSVLRAVLNRSAALSI